MYASKFTKCIKGVNAKCRNQVVDRSFRRKAQIRAPEGKKRHEGTGLKMVETCAPRHHHVEKLSSSSPESGIVSSHG